MNSLAEQVRQRFAPLMERERQRLEHRFRDADCAVRPRLQAWEVTRVIRGFDGDEEALIAWMHAATPEHVRPIVCGYDDLLEALERGEQEAEAAAVQVLRARLCVARAMLCARWMVRMATDSPPGTHQRDLGDSDVAI